MIESPPKRQKHWTSRELNPGPPVNQMLNSCYLLNRCATNCATRPLMFWLLLLVYQLVCLSCSVLDQIAVLFLLSICHESMPPYIHALYIASILESLSNRILRGTLDVMIRHTSMITKCHETIPLQAISRIPGLNIPRISNYLAASRLTELTKYEGQPQNLPADPVYHPKDPVLSNLSLGSTPVILPSQFEALRITTT